MGGCICGETPRGRVTAGAEFLRKSPTACVFLGNPSGRSPGLLGCQARGRSVAAPHSSPRNPSDAAGASYEADDVEVRDNEFEHG